MNYENLNNKLKELNIEEIIWIIYLGIIFLSFYSNYLEKRYFLYNDLLSKEKYRQTLIIIFSILIIIYLYFLYQAYQDIKNIKPNDSEKKKKLLHLAFLGSFLIVLSGIIFLYIAINDQNIDVELAFN